jgi:hypothetical protein
LDEDEAYEAGKDMEAVLLRGLHWAYVASVEGNVDEFAKAEAALRLLREEGLRGNV